MRLWINWLPAITLALAVGCGGPTDKLNLVPVTGTITLEGQPLSGATVTYFPQAAQGVAASATTDDHGKYTLQTAGAQRPGAVPGGYNVTVMKTEVKQLTTEEQAIAQTKMKGKSMFGPPLTEAKQLLPLKYRNPTQSGFTATVSESGKNSFDFDVKGK